MKKKFTNKRILWAFTLAFMCVVYLITATLIKLHHVNTETSNVKAALDRMLQLENLLVNVHLIETAERGFIITGDENLLEVYYKGMAGIKRDTVLLNSIHQNSQEKKILIKELLLLIDSKVRFSREAIEKRNMHGYDSLKDVINIKDEPLLMKKIYSIIETLENQDRPLLQESNSKRIAFAKRTSQQLFTLGFLFALILFMTYYTINQDFKKVFSAEQQLKFNASLIRNISDPIITTDIFNKITNWNAYAEQLYGYTETEVLGADADKILKIDNSNKELTEVKDASSKIDFWKGELMHRHKNGTSVFTEVTTSAIIDEKGNKAGTVSVIRDITDRKNTEEQLKRLTTNLEEEVKIKAAELNTIFERITDAFIALDNNWNYTYVNKKAAELHNRQMEDLIGKNIWEENPDVTIEQFYKALQYAKQTNLPQRLELYYSKTDKWFEDLIYPSPDGISVYYHDITNKKNAELALQKTHEKLSYHVNNSPLGVVEFEMNLHIMQWSNRAAEIFGWSMEELWDQEDKLDVLIYKDDIPMVEEAMTNLSEKKITSGVLKMRNIRKDGTIIFCEWYNSVLINEKGDVTGVMCMVLDITERIKSQQELSQSEELYRTITEQASDGVFISSGADGKFEDINSNGEQLTGYSKQELIHLYLTDLIPTDELEKNPFKYAILKTGKVVINERILKRKDGSLREIEVSAKLLQDGRLIGIARDITARKKAEEVLKASEQKYRLLFNQNPMPMWMLSLPDNTFLDVNNAAVEFYGYSKIEFLNMNVLDIRPEHTYQKYRDFDFGDNKTGIRDAGIWEHKKKDGTLIKVNTITHNIFYEGKNVRLVLAYDVTQKLAAEEELNKSHEQLRQLATHLEKVREMERTHIAREIHDELGQQLTGLKMDISWLNRKLKSQDAEVQTKINETILLIDETVKTVRRISTELRPSILDDLGLIAAMEWQSEEFQKRSEIACLFRSNVSEFKIEPDLATGVFRIYQECLTNVFRHAAATQVNSYLEIQPNELVMSISDNGIGFMAEDIANKKTLGILGMKERTSLLGGIYEITSFHGKGTSVKIIVPLNK